MNDKINQMCADFGVKILIRYKYLVLFLVLAFVIFCFLGMSQLVMDNRAESFFTEDDEIILRNNRFKEIFGNEDFIFLLVQNDEVFSRDVLSFIRNLSRDFSENLPFLKDITSLTDMEYINVIDGDLYVEDLIEEEIPVERNTLEKIKQKILAKDIYLNRIITRDAKNTGIFLEFEKYPDVVYVPKKQNTSDTNIPYLQKDIFFEDEIKDFNQHKKIIDPRKLVAPAYEYVLKQYDSEKYNLASSGSPISNYHISKAIQKDVGKTILITLIIAIILLIVIFRSFPAVLTPVLVIFASIIITFGSIGWLGMPMSNFASVLACLILVLTVSYSIHIINHFLTHFRKTGKRLDSIRYAFEHATWPCLITAATTAVGFLSFLVVPLVPIRILGISCTIGVAATYLLVMLVIPAVYSFGRDREISEKNIWKNIKQNPGFMTKWADFALNSFKYTGMVSVLVICFLSFFIGSIDVDTDFIRMFGDRNQFVKEAKQVTNYLGALYSYEILIELPEPGMAKEPEVLQSLEELTKMIDSHQTTELTMSINDLVKDISMTLNNNDRYYYRIPEKREQIAQYLLLYEMSGGELLNNWIDYEDKNLRLSVQANQASFILHPHFAEIKQFGQKNFPRGTIISINGTTPMFLKSSSLLIRGQINSIMIAFIGITIMMMLILRSIPVGLLSMIPNILPVAFVMGIMGLFKFTLNMQTIVVAPLLIGIAVDDTVHYFLHFRTEFIKTGSYKMANRETFRKIGWALVFTSIILILGFSAFTFSSITSIIHIAVLLTSGILIALLADLLITPALFVLFKPFGREAGNRKNEKIKKIKHLKSLLNVSK